MVETVNYKNQMMGLWCSCVFFLLTAIGWFGIAHFWLPAPADLSAEATKIFYVETYRFPMLLGNSIFIVGSAFLVPASIQFGISLSKIEGKFPIWSITTAIGGILISVIVFLNACFWIAAAYRPDASADVIVALNDASWLGFLLGWVYLSLQMVAAAIVTLADKRKEPVIPRWLSKASICGAILLVTAGGPAFFQSGVFAYHGILGFYVPMIIWTVWDLLHVYYFRKELLRESKNLK